MDELATQASPDAGPGQAGEPAPESHASGQATAQGSTATGQASAPATEPESFFDPSQVPPELLPAYKSMQKTWTKKNQEFAELRKQVEHKVQAYDAFDQNPVETLQKIAGQLGYKLSRAEAEAAVASQEEWQPQTWDDLLSKAEERAEARILGKLAPFLQNVQSLQQSTMEEQLDGIDPAWREHEKEFIAAVRDYPKLATDLKKLFRFAMPEDYVMSRATQAALKQAESKVKQAAVGGGSSQRQAAPAERKVTNYNDAVLAAKAELAARGGG